MEDKLETIRFLEEKFARITNLLYNTEVPPATLTDEVLPHLSEDVYFKDPWQVGGGKDRYTLGMKGFHSMFYFDFEIMQLNVSLREDDPRDQFIEGRVVVDGIMNLKQFSWLFTYPLRTILVYKFKLNKNHKKNGRVHFEIFHHEEMWSFGDMIQNFPLFSFPYELFRNAFASGFLAASSVSLWFQNHIRGDEWK